MNLSSKAAGNSPQSPSLAVITVCWNALEGLVATAASVQRQSAPGIVHVVVDGGSIDGTVEWLNLNRAQLAVALSEPDKGIYDAMNKAIDLCPEVDWIIFLNAGDTFHSPDVVRAASPMLRRDDIDFLYGDVSIHDAGGPGRPLTYPARRVARLEMPGCHQSCFVRGRVMKQFKFDLQYRVAGDFECWLRATRGGGSKTAFVEHTIATIAPEGYSARNESTLQCEYARAIGVHVNVNAARWWLFKRKARQFALMLRRTMMKTVT